MMRRMLTPTLLALTVLLATCGRDRPTEAPLTRRTGRMKVCLTLPKAAVADVVRVEAVVEGTDFAPIRQELIIMGDKAVGTIENIPAGKNRRFTLNAYDSEGNLLYTGSAISDVIADETVQVTITMRRVGQPQEPTLAYVLNYESGNILVLDTGSNQYIAAIPLGGTPEDLVFSSIDFFVYVIDGTPGVHGGWATWSNTSILSSVLSNSHSVTANLKLPKVDYEDRGNKARWPREEWPKIKEQGVASSPDGTEVCVTRGPTDYVTIVDISSWEPIVDISTGWQTLPADVVASKDGHLWLVVCALSNEVVAIDRQTRAIVSRINVGTRPRRGFLSSDGRYLCVCSWEDNTVSIIDVLLLLKIKTIETGVNPFGGDFTPDGQRLYVSNYGSNSITVIKTDDWTVETTIEEIGANPSGAAITPDGKTLYVALQGAASVAVIDVASNTVTQTLPAGDQPTEIVIIPGL